MSAGNSFGAKAAPQGGRPDLRDLPALTPARAGAAPIGRLPYSLSGAAEILSSTE